MPSAAHRVADVLRAWNVGRVYAASAPARGPMGDALAAAGSPPVPVGHPERAALMAGAHAHVAAWLGCCLAPSPVEALRMLGGLRDDAAAGRPVLVLVADPAAGEAGADPSPGAARRLLAQTAASYREVHEASQVVGALDGACEAALTARAAAVVVLPHHVLRQRAHGAPGDRPRGPVPGALPWQPPRPAPDAHALDRAAAVLNGARRPLVAIGPGAHGAGGPALGAAELLGAGLVTHPAARDALPDSVPFLAGRAGPWHDSAAAALLGECDTLLVIGDTGVADWATGRDAAVVRVGSSGDSVPGATGFGTLARSAEDLADLLPLLHRAAGRDWRAKVEKRTAAWRETCRKRARRHFGLVVNPQSVAAQLSRVLPDAVVLTAGSGAAAAWADQHVSLRTGMLFCGAGSVYDPAAGITCAVAARFAAPGRPVVALAQDAPGAQAAGALALLAQLAPRLGGPPLVVAALTPARPADRLHPAAAAAEAAGVPALRCADPRRVAAAWQEALRAEGPVVVDFAVDSEITPGG